MRLGVWSGYLGGLSPEEMVSAFAARGWSELELSSEDGATLLERGDPGRAGREFRKFASECGVSFPQGHLWLDCDIAAGDQDEVIDKLRSWVDLFLAVGVRAMVIHPGGDELFEPGGEPAELLERRVRGFSLLCEHIEGADGWICLENGAGGVEELLGVIEAVGSGGMGICLDTGHLNMIGGDQGRFIDKAGSYLKATHLADNDGSSDQHLMPFSIGTVDWETVVAGLKRIGYGGLCNFEIPGESHCPLPARLAKLDYLKSIAQLMFETTHAEDGQ